MPSVIGGFRLGQEVQDPLFVGRVILHSPVCGIRDIHEPVEVFLGGMRIQGIHFFVKI